MRFLDTDVRLLQQARTGDRRAYGQIVERYQNLVCAVAYSRLGDFGQSEDVAQETFVAAWRQLAELNEPSKLKAWLCGIARNQSSNVRRRLAADVGSNAAALEQPEAIAASAAEPVDAAIAQEEQAMLWSILQTLPQAYREPLVLYYRSEHSVAQVAEELQLSQDAVKQRLHRGRKLLSDKVAGFVDETLRRSRPGKALVIAVLAALPAAAPQAAAAAVSVAAGKGLVGKTAAASAGLSAAVVGPIIGVLGGAIGAGASIRAARSRRERRFVIRMTAVVAALVGLLLGSQAIGVLFFPEAYATVAFQVALWSVYIAALVGLIAFGNRRQRRIQIEEGTLQPAAATAAELRWDDNAVRSFRWGLFGAMVGSSAWLVPLGWAANDPWPPSLCMAAILLGWHLIANWFASSPGPARRYGAFAAAILLVCVAELTVLSLRWSVWQQSRPEHASNQVDLWVISLLVAGIGAGMFAYCLALARAAGATR